jgi:ribosomal protein S18 acetylase RimI-like enzyme
MARVGDSPLTTGVRSFEAGDESAVRAIMEASLAVDGIPGFVASDVERALVRIVPDPAGTVVRVDEPAPRVRVGEVMLIGVLPAWRGRGLGRELLRWAVSELRDRGAGAVQLSVEARNERATNLYRRHGFEPAIEWPHWVLPIA